MIFVSNIRSIYIAYHRISYISFNCHHWILFFYHNLNIMSAELNVIKQLHPNMSKLPLYRVWGRGWDMADALKHRNTALHVCTIKHMQLEMSLLWTNCHLQNELTSYCRKQRTAKHECQCVCEAKYACLQWHAHARHVRSMSGIPSCD